MNFTKICKSPCVQIGYEFINYFPSSSFVNFNCNNEINWKFVNVWKIPFNLLGRHSVACFVRLCTGYDNSRLALFSFHPTATSVLATCHANAEKSCSRHKISHDTRYRRYRRPRAKCPDISKIECPGIETRRRSVAVAVTGEGGGIPLQLCLNLRYSNKFDNL